MAVIRSLTSLKYANATVTLSKAPNIFKMTLETNLTNYLSINNYLLCLCLLLIVGYSYFVTWIFRKGLNLPPGPIGLPFIGYLPFLGKEPYKCLDRLKLKYGNVFSVNLGRRNVIILADYKAVEDAFSKTATLHRPEGLFDFLPEGFGFTGLNGHEWTEQRRFVIKTMRDLGLGRNLWTTLVENEVADFVKVIVAENGNPINIYEYLCTSVSNNIYSLVFGKRLPRGPALDTLNSSSDAVMKFFEQSGLHNYFPTICKMLSTVRIGHFHKSFEGIKVFNTFIRNELENHRKFQKDTEATDFITQYLEAMKNCKGSQKEAHFNETNIIGNAQALFVGGSDTITASLIWLFLAMAAFPKVQRNVYAELESLLGKDGTALWEDRAKFPYTYAVIMEGQRWRTIIPLNTQRIAAEDITVCGYDVPKGSTIIGNNWGLHNDSHCWIQPKDFIPERFLLNGGEKVNLMPESFVPFSYGKRKCPGGTIAMMEIFLYFTVIVHRFEVRAPNGVKPNLDGILGLTYKPVPQTLCFIPRHTNAILEN